MPSVRTGPTIGLIFHFAVLNVLAGTVGLGTAGWVVGFASGTVTFLVLAHGLQRTGAEAFGAANWVTLLRAGLIGGIAALTADSFTGPVSIPVLVTLSAVALALDAVDGNVARRTGSCTPLGARFDMETDAWLILVLSAFVAESVGAWVLAIGLMRYVIGLATWLVPWLRGPVPPRYWRKVVAAMQGVTLAVAASGLLPLSVTTTVVAISLLFLVESFGSEVLWRWRRQSLTVAAAS
ncbi:MULTISPECIES: CDP-alcohol phosphatidyltransferase family protein [Dactylosporangium]|uniref:Membrane protein n=2 Tax=Dactylosporangium TaxID=35753 RepID=A0A9W6KNQ4_9ACTN|nr:MULTISPECIES: CDP-alcohol phosphatidyltransferase family protein [Dactylosporangium]GLL03979.1 membrane protein [Dactylosporangium matsuzakiense]